jgi:hypothetical protein
MKMEQSVPETSAYKIQTPGNYTEESIQVYLVGYFLFHCTAADDSHVHTPVYLIFCAFENNESPNTLQPEGVVRRLL